MASDRDPRLGCKQAEFRPTWFGSFLRAFLGVGLIILGLAMIGRLVFLAINGEPLPDGDPKLLFAFCFIGGWMLLYSFAAPRRTRVEVYDHGLQISHDLGQTSCLWTEIDVLIEEYTSPGELLEFLAKAMNSEASAFRLQLVSGKEVTLKSYISRLAKLGAIIKRNTLPHLLGQCLVQLKEGQRIGFGPLSVDEAGIALDNKKLVWHQVQGAERKDCWIKVYQRGAWLTWKSVKLSEMPNAHVFLELIAQQSQRSPNSG